jgi:hypothetical protein
MEKEQKRGTKNQSLGNKILNLILFFGKNKN